ncbi:MAG: Rdx family protein [Chloroflexota bacterium]|nr:Rdx family protein [Chloroflexota bacterium]
MAETVLKNYHEKFDAVTLIPSSGGVFEVTLGDKQIFSKKRQGRFPEDEEVLSRVEAL